MSNTEQKALIYCRVSDSKQSSEGSGLQSQEHRCRQHAGALGLIVDEVFRDEYTGGGDYKDRPGMSALLKYMSKHKKQRYVVIFDDLKRLSRDTRYYLELKDVFASYGAKLECLNFKFDETPEGEFHEELVAATGKLERRQIARQTRQKTQARLEAGLYAFTAPKGYKFIFEKPRGNVLFPDEPVASALREALEGFASGRFQTKVEVKRFLENHPDFPIKGAKMGNGRIDRYLKNPVYAGYIEHKPWNITLREGQHKGLINFETYLKIQERMKTRTHAAARKDLNQVFPLRGSVNCTCGNQLTGYHAKSATGRNYAYYMCQKNGCEHKDKSIRKADMEEAFVELLNKLTPSHSLIKVVGRMLSKQWKMQETASMKHQETYKKQVQEIDSQISDVLDNIVIAKRHNTIAAFENRIDELERDKLLLKEKIAVKGRPVRDYDDIYRTSLLFLQNPSKMWELGGFEDKRTVLKLCFSGRLVYDRNKGYQTPNLSLPFSMLEALEGRKNNMVPRGRLELPRT